jgi:hypothetical protein
VPNGRATFRNPSEHLDFERTGDREMLVAAGNRAQFWDTGTLIEDAPARGASWIEG